MSFTVYTYAYNITENAFSKLVFLLHDDNQRMSSKNAVPFVGQNSVGPAIFHRRYRKQCVRKSSLARYSNSDVWNSILSPLPNTIPAIYQNRIVSDWQTKSDGRVGFDNNNRLRLARDWLKKKKLLILMLLFFFLYSENRDWKCR